VNITIVVVSAALGVALVEMIDRRSLFGPALVVREALSVPQPRLGLGSPGWAVGLALAFPAFVVAAFSLLPWGTHYAPADAVPGIFLASMLLDFAAVCVAGIGWSANRVLGVASLFGAILQFVSYGIVIGFGMIGPAMAAQSLAPHRIGEAQQVWYAVTQPGSLALYALGALAQSFRPPFDAPLAGTFDALGGVPRLAFRWGLDLLVFTVAAYGAVLFFGAGGGTSVGLFSETLLLVALMTTLRRVHWTYPRMLSVFWRLAMPVALINIVLVGAVILLRWS
jgi:NADH-quinone oxidoreductase subunit H